MKLTYSELVMRRLGIEGEDWSPDMGTLVRGEVRNELTEETRSDV